MASYDGFGNPTATTTTLYTLESTAERRERCFSCLKSSHQGPPVKNGVMNTTS
jgi:hypothetical protein